MSNTSRRPLAGLATLLVAAVLLLIGTARAEAANAVDVGKFAAVVMDAATGEVLYEYEPDARRFPASLTKVMTLYMAFDALEHGKLQRESKVTMSRHSAAQPPSKLGLPVGGQLTVAQAMDVMVVKSANDVASALAETLGGSERAFARQMTERARELGMTGTHFMNASGLPNSRHVSTARDMAIMARSFLRDHPQDYRLFDQEQTVFRGRTIHGHNRLLARTGVDGFKTGYTNASGYNLLTSGVQDGRRIIAVVLGGRTAHSRDQLMRALMGAGFTTLAVRYAGIDVSMRHLLGVADPAYAAGRQLAAAHRPAASKIAQGDQDVAKAARSKGAWWVQVGAFRDKSRARSQLAALGRRHPKRLGQAAYTLEPSGKLFLARFGGLTDRDATSACELLRSEGADCLAGSASAD
ncbi:D-alanyl-D-alanine carboxypeptidase [Phenylobacterium sp.]|uniref:D-alanyl-D-alanine carboxypeptidase n=1 Tax=Phenylobacterium sp. TaxID=1871053 RepID=UPI0030F3AD3C